jgi:1-acyl-sn-glycerol-3-phosphate acyltransferase
MGSFFTAIYDFFVRRPLAFVAALLLLLAFIGWFGIRIGLEEDINKVIPATEANSRMITALQHSSFSDRLVICISLHPDEQSPDAGLLINFAGALIDSLALPEARQYIASVEGVGLQDEATGLYGLFYRYLPLFLDREDYETLSGLTSDSAIGQSVKRNYEALLTPGGFAMRDFILKDPLGFTPIALRKLESLNVSSDFSLYKDHIVSADKRNLLMFVIPARPPTETKENARLLALIDHYGDKLSAHFNEKAKLIYFGSVAASVSNASRIKADIIISVGIAGILLIILLGLYFRKRFRFLFIFLPALLGGGFALAMLYLIRTEVSAISLGLGSVMLGISVDYAIHFLSHLRHTGSVRTVISDIAGPVMMSSITTASAFLCLMVMDSEALRDLGLFAAISVFSSALFTLGILPRFLHDIPPHKTNVKPNALVSIINKIATYPWHRKRKLILLIIGMLVLFVFTSRQVKFDSNMDRMNYLDGELRQAENFLDSISSYKLRSVFVVSAAPRLDEALQANERLVPLIDSLHALGVVKSYSSVHPFFPGSGMMQERRQAWDEYWTEGRIDSLRSALTEASGQYRFRKDAFDGFFDWLEKGATPAEHDQLGELRQAYLDEFIVETDSLAFVTTLLKVSPEDKPAVYRAFEGHEEVIVYDRQSVTAAFMEGLQDNFDRLVLLSLLLVFIILTLSFGRLELSIITFIPLVVSWVWTLGIMGLFGISFNIFNVVISTFVFGLGIDYAIFGMRGLLQEYQYGRKKLNSYKTSILLSGITTIVGIGALIFARHPALHSIAISAITGIASVVLITFTLLPLLFGFLVRHEGRIRKWPVTLKDFIFSVNTFLIFLFGVIVLNIAGLLLKYLVPIRTKRKKLIFHQMFSLACWTIVYGSVNIRKTFWNRSREDFKKPAVVICNHQSHLDTVLNIMQNPRMVLLTHGWVQKSIFFGWFVRFADFYSVSSGLGPIMDDLRKITANGYSVFIFPEGTRSRSLEIGRFHQGAFYLAKTLNMDILPVISYGSGNAMPKYEPFLKTSPTTMTILPRITPDDPLIKENTLATSRAVRHHMKKEYAAIREKIETPAFYRKLVVRNYLFRGPVLEWYMKIKIRMEKNYVLFHDILPREGLITDIGCGYGFMAYMLLLMAPGRRFIACDYDADKIDTASHCALKNDRINFIRGDITMIEPEASDAFIMADVLHYLRFEEQEKLIARCVEKLNKNGVIIIRDADPGMKRRQRGTALSEFFSTRLSFNLTRDGHKKLYFTPREAYEKIFAGLGLDVEIIDETSLTSNLVYVLRKKHG